MPSFTEQLIAARKAAEMTQADLAAAVGVTRSTVSSWERGRTRPNLETLQLLSQVLSFDFISGYKKPDSAAGPEPEDTEIPASEPVSDIQTPAAPSVRKRRLPLILCAAALLAAVCLGLHFLLPARQPVGTGTPPPDVDPALLALE